MCFQSTADLIIDESMCVELEPVGSQNPVGPSEQSNGKSSNGSSNKTQPKDPRPFRHLVIDCTSMAFVDPVGIKTFKQVSSGTWLA